MFFADYIANDTRAHSKTIPEQSNYTSVIVPTARESVYRYRNSFTNSEDRADREDKILGLIQDQSTGGYVYANGWRTHPFRVYGQDVNSADEYPTVRTALEYFGPACVGIAYNTLYPNTHIPTHVDLENINGEYINVHLPLALEDGKAYMIIEQTNYPLVRHELHFLQSELLHSAHNASDTTDRVNVMFIFDKSKSFK